MADHEEDDVSLARKKKIHVNAASLVDLKAALYRKQQEVKREKVGKTRSSDGLPVTKVSDKTSSIWRKPTGGTTSSKVKRIVGSSKKATQDTRAISAEEETALARSKAALEAKAALYDKLHRGEGLDDSDDEEGLDPRYMVDFQRKIYEQVSLRQQQSEDIETKTLIEPKNDPRPKSDEEWVEYTDSFGRSRQCMKKDLPHMMNLDSELKHVRPPSPLRSGSRSPLPEDRLREEDWEQEMDEKSEGPIHYQTVQHGEIRTHGVGYYGFASEEDRRKEQLQMLNSIRDETVDQRKRRERLKEKRKALMDARLAKIKKHKLDHGKEMNNDEEIKVDIAGFDFNSGAEQKSVASDEGGIGDIIAQEIIRAREKAEEEKRANHVRPWDRGKKMDPIRKRKKELQDERLSEFAPPSSYQLPKPSTNQPSASGEDQSKQDTDKDSGPSAQPGLYPPNPYFVLPGYPPPVFFTPGFVPTSSYSHYPTNQ